MKLKILITAIIISTLTFTIKAETIDVTAEIAKKEISISNVTNIDFGIIRQTAYDETCTMIFGGTLSPIDNCLQQTTATHGSIDILASKNSQIQVTGTLATTNGFTYTPHFGDDTTQTETYISTTDSDGNLNVIVTGSLLLDVSEIQRDTKTNLISTINATYF